MVVQRIRLKRMMCQLDEKLKRKKAKKEYFAELKSMTKKQEVDIVKRAISKEHERIMARFKRDQEKLKYEKQDSHLSKADYTEKLKQLKEDHKARLEKHKAAAQVTLEEAKKQHYEIKSNMTVEKLEQQVEKLDQRINNTILQKQDKEDNSSVALGTSKMNYIDPRLTVMFSKKYDVPIEKLFTKTLRDKFAWAIESADADWEF
ncbi:unnamed protein product [Ambrosiozyma monospora]|uniref:Unnamed protein product n=1 Tax=Ambrosiozyma monospora TaxID=43982 RepID=A0ACB5TW98_AMBMO|nr:unnamed protein product [Ambrosiozyma monospora]